MLVALIIAYTVIALLAFWFLWHTRRVEPTTLNLAVRDAILWFPWVVFILGAMIYLSIEAVYVHIKEKRKNPATRFFQD